MVVRPPHTSMCAWHSNRVGRRRSLRASPSTRINNNKHTEDNTHRHDTKTQHDTWRVSNEDRRDAARARKRQVNCCCGLRTCDRCLLVVNCEPLAESGIADLPCCIALAVDCDNGLTVHCFWTVV